MSKCAAHQGRGRAPKGCPACNAGKPVVIASTVQSKIKVGHYAPPDAIPNVTPDGMTFLDPDGNEPQLDARGWLTAPFVFQAIPGRRENWAAGTKLPLTPMAYQQWASAITEARAKIHKPKVKE